MTALKLPTASQPTFHSNVCNLGNRVSHFSCDWAEKWWWGGLGVLEGGCIRDVTKPFVEVKVKPIFLSALFCEVPRQRH